MDFISYLGQISTKFGTMFMNIVKAFKDFNIQAKF